MKSQTKGVPIACLQNSPSETEQSSKSSIRLATSKKQVHSKRKSNMVQMFKKNFLLFFDSLIPEDSTDS